MDFPTIVGFVGVILMLIAFLLNLAGRMAANDVPYLLLNFVGACLAGWSSWMIHFLPFVLLEGTWALVAGIGLVRRLGREEMRRTP